MKITKVPSSIVTDELGEQTELGTYTELHKDAEGNPITQIGSLRTTSTQGVFLFNLWEDETNRNDYYLVEVCVMGDAVAVMLDIRSKIIADETLGLI